MKQSIKFLTDASIFVNISKIIGKNSNFIHFSKFAMKKNAFNFGRNCSDELNIKYIEKCGQQFGQPKIRSIHFLNIFLKVHLPPPRKFQISACLSAILVCMCVAYYTHLPLKNAMYMMEE